MIELHQKGMQNPQTPFNKKPREAEASQGFLEISLEAVNDFSISIVRRR
jgi:hypothetical protein